MPSISAVTITWNSREVISGCLESLLAEGTDIAEIIVVDNASTDGTRELIREQYPTVRLIENEENLGFAGGANQGIRASSGEFVLLVNPDVSFEAGFVASLVDAISKDGRAGAAAPKLIRPGGGVIDSAGLLMRKDRKAVDRGRDEQDTGQYDTPCRVFGACGAAALLRRSMLEDVAVGGEYFDETFFAYKEDVDLAWRANLLGWKAVYVPGASAVHGRGWKQSSRDKIPRYIRRHSHKNRYLAILKNDDLVNLVAHLPHVLFYELKLFVYSLLFEPFLLLAYWDAILLFGAALKKREAVMARRRLSPREMRGLFV
jgi:GT2 family glycosyltransferase